MEEQNSRSPNDVSKSLKLQNSIIEPLQQQLPINFKTILEMQLHQYDDIEDQDFQLVQDNFEQQIRHAKQYQSTYMHQHSNIIPIGTNYQAQIPQILPEQHYKIKSRDMIKRLYIMKINDPVKSKEFLDKYKQVIDKTFEQFQLTEEDYVLMYNNYKQYGNEGDVPFDVYLEKTIIYWNKYFTAKQKITSAKNNTKKKKKKNKGSIPI